ncbi:hypothetical protein CDIK_3173 [Cucumispora dikerogammari]|nr:hypothetical protein CDIK_3173 [Cucumispora dikerogammari]
MVYEYEMLLNSLTISSNNNSNDNPLNLYSKKAKLNVDYNNIYNIYGKTINDLSLVKIQAVDFMEPRIVNVNYEEVKVWDLLKRRIKKQAVERIVERFFLNESAPNPGESHSALFDNKLLVSEYDKNMNESSIQSHARPPLSTILASSDTPSISDIITDNKNTSIRITILDKNSSVDADEKSSTVASTNKKLSHVLPKFLIDCQTNADKTPATDVADIVGDQPDKSTKLPSSILSQSVKSYPSINPLSSLISTYPNKQSESYITLKKLNIIYNDVFINNENQQ